MYLFYSLLISALISFVFTILCEFLKKTNPKTALVSIIISKIGHLSTVIFTWIFVYKVCQLL